jgi:hypothetical protein
LRRERTEFEERAVGIDQRFDAVAYEQFAALPMALDRLLAAALFHVQQALPQRIEVILHVRGVGLEQRIGRCDFRLQYIHGQTFHQFRQVM